MRLMHQWNCLSPIKKNAYWRRNYVKPFESKVLLQKSFEVSDRSKSEKMIFICVVYTLN